MKISTSSEYCKACPFLMALLMIMSHIKCVLAKKLLHPLWQQLFQRQMIESCRSCCWKGPQIEISTAFEKLGEKWPLSIFQLMQMSALYQTLCDLLEPFHYCRWKRTPPTSLQASEPEIKMLAKTSFQRLQLIFSARYLDVCLYSAQPQSTKWQWQKCSED